MAHVSLQSEWVRWTFQTDWCKYVIWQLKISTVDNPQHANKCVSLIDTADCLYTMQPQKAQKYGGTV